MTKHSVGRVPDPGFMTYFLLLFNRRVQVPLLSLWKVFSQGLWTQQAPKETSAKA